MARLLLGVSGGIAAYKALELARLATSAGHAVRVLRTESAARFVGDASFEGITGAPVLHDQWARDPARGVFPDQTPPDHDPISHLEVVGNADVFLVAPATANVLAKLAAGLADDLLTTAALAARCPVVVAPAMNNHMYEHAATQANIATLRSRGVTVVDPGVGPLASRGEHGPGRLPEPAELLAVVESLSGGGGPTAPTTRSPQRGRVGKRLLPERDGVVGGAARARVRRRDARADRQRALRRQPLVGAHGVRDRRGGGAARRGGDGRRGERVAGAAARDRVRRRRDRRAAARRVRAVLRRLRRARHGRGRRRLPAGRRRRRDEAQEGGGADAVARPRAHRRRAVPRSARAGVRGRRSWASRPSMARTRSPSAAPSWSARGWTFWWSTTSPARTSASRSTRTRSRSSVAPATRRSRARPRPRSPEGCSTRCARARAEQPAGA